MKSINLTLISNQIQAGFSPKNAGICDPTALVRKYTGLGVLVSAKLLICSDSEQSTLITTVIISLFTRREIALSPFSEVRITPLSLLVTF